MEESGRVPGKGRICATIEKQSGRVPKKGRISVSTEKGKNPGEYSKKVESVRLSKNSPDEYQKMVESVWVSKMDESGRVAGKARICASIEKLPRQLPEMGRISVSTEKW